MKIQRNGQSFIFFRQHSGEEIGLSTKTVSEPENLWFEKFPVRIFSNQNLLIVNFKQFLKFLN